MTRARRTKKTQGDIGPRRTRVGVALFAFLVLLGSAAAAQEPLKKLPSDARKTIRKAVDGDEKALARLQALGPLTKKAAEEAQKKVLNAWPFKSLKSGRSKVELDFLGTKREYALYAPKGYSNGFSNGGNGAWYYAWLEIPEGAGQHVEAEVKKNEIEISGTSRAVLWLSDGLVDLDAEVVVRLDGEEAFRGIVPRKLTDLVADLQARFDRTAPAFARLEVPPR